MIGLVWHGGSWVIVMHVVVMGGWVALGGLHGSVWVRRDGVG